MCSKFVTSVVLDYSFVCTRNNQQAILFEVTAVTVGRKFMNLPLLSDYAGGIYFPDVILWTPKTVIFFTSPLLS